MGVSNSDHPFAKRGRTISLLPRFSSYSDSSFALGVYSMSRNVSARIGRRRCFITLLNTTWIPSERSS